MERACTENYTTNISLRNNSVLGIQITRNRSYSNLSATKSISNVCITIKSISTSASASTSTGDSLSNTIPCLSCLNSTDIELKSQTESDSKYIFTSSGVAESFIEFTESRTLNVKQTSVVNAHLETTSVEISMRQYDTQDASAAEKVCGSSNEIVTLKKTNVLSDESKTNNNKHSKDELNIEADLSENLMLKSKAELMDENSPLSLQLALQGTMSTKNRHIDQIERDNTQVNGIQHRHIETTNNAIIIDRSRSSPACGSFVLTNGLLVYRTSDTASPIPLLNSSVSKPLEDSVQRREDDVARFAEQARQKRL
jgi:hypothetical protein